MLKMGLIGTIRKRHQERKDKKKTVRQTVQRNEQLEVDTHQTHVAPTTPTPAQHLPFTGPTRFFSLRRKRGVSIGMSTYEQLPNGVEPALIDHSCHLMQRPSSEELPDKSPFATPPPADATSTPNQDTSPKTWLSRVGGSLRRKPSGIRSAFSYTLPRNWKSNNNNNNSTGVSAQALAETAHEYKKSQIRRLDPSAIDAANDDGRGRSPLPHHWREQSSSSVSHSRDGVVNRMSDTTNTTMEGSEMGDWIDPDEERREQEFEDWIVHNRLFVEGEGLDLASRRVSRVSALSKRRYSDY
ncbi:uncharacterized protein J4E92_004580 [Alternaria infectoria]|uniref:uncharacterized protein n=1 Tax=Alternaria infectoria TaxID=45303 RepID=UPI002220EF82|nr:uncharacterized protein J4E92_004580 [Alternaria infectoria]KAI4930748.1 hypothetical protein J4E92_004580 [Alternaria infectoria]